MELKEFMALMGVHGKAAGTKKQSGKADWEKAIAEATKSGRSYTIVQVHRDLINGAVSKGRVRGKLNDLFEKGQVARAYDGLQYHYCFAPEAIELQHGKRE